MKQYRLTLNENQVKALKDICELRFRIDLCQEFDLADVLAGMAVPELEEDDSRREKVFDDYICRREHISIILRALFDIAVPMSLRMSGGRVRRQTPLIAEDIWQVLRHQLWLDDPNRDKYGYVTDSKKPLQVSEEPLPIIERINDESK